LPLIRLSRRALLPGLAAFCLVLWLALVLAAGPAAAHALVMSSQPEAGAELAAAPTKVVLRFNSRIDHERSRLTLFGPVTAAGAGNAPGNAGLPLPLAAEQEPAVLEATVPGTLAPGEWRLRWQVLAVDGHITRGDIFFTIQGP
jgi:copper resistance protein C